jgi:hypothetical protein
MRRFYAPASHADVTFDRGGVAMSVSRVFVILLGVWLTVARSAIAQSQQPQPCATAVPRNVDAGVLASDVLALLRLSDTFRSQCARIAADPRVRVRLSITCTVEGNGRAQTIFRRYRTGTLVAEVDILFGENYRELLAHEFEHVLEQLDGVNVRREAAEGRAWEVATGAFETRRAFLAGTQALREAERVHAPSAAVLPLR